MNETVAGPVGRALWYIETHFADPAISLDTIEPVAGVSRFHLARAFAGATGFGVMEYVRARRLSEAARALAAGAPDILTVALDAGYGSHEAFTRAFREQFGTTPEAVRERGTVDGLMLVEAMRRDNRTLVALEPPQIEHAARLLIAGFAVRDLQRIMLTWQRLGPHIGAMPNQVGRIAYGVCTDQDDDGAFTYVAGVEVARFDAIPDEMTCMRIAERDYAVFVHRGHVSAIRATFESIWQTWQPPAGWTIADAPMFERYGEDFDGERGTGNVGIWIPLERTSGSA